MVRGQSDYKKKKYVPILCARDVRLRVLGMPNRFYFMFILLFLLWFLIYILYIMVYNTYSEFSRKQPLNGLLMEIYYIYKESTFVYCHHIIL